jgi:hypothetical protein
MQSHLTYYLCLFSLLFCSHTHFISFYWLSNIPHLKWSTLTFFLLMKMKTLPNSCSHKQWYNKQLWNLCWLLTIYAWSVPPKCHSCGNRRAFKFLKKIMQMTVLLSPAVGERTQPPCNEHYPWTLLFVFLVKIMTVEVYISILNSLTF